MTITFMAFKFTTFLLSFLEIYLCFELLEAVFKRQISSRWFKAVQLIITLILGYLLALNKVTYLIYANSLLVIHGIFIGVIGIILYRSKAAITLAFTLACQVVIYSLDLIYLYGSAIIWNNPHIGIEINSTSPQLSIYYTFCTRLTLLLVVILIKKYPLDDVININDYIVPLVLFNIVGYLGVIFFQRIFSIEMTSLLIINGFTYICTILLGILVFMVYIIFQKSRRKTTLIQLRNEMLEKNYTSMELAYHQQAKLFHDFQNHLLVLHGMLQHNQAAKAISYIKMMQEPLAKVSNRSNSYNEAIDLILNFKIAEAEEKMIEVDTAIEDCSSIHIPGNDISTLIAHIMDQAIEASAKLSKENPRISIHIHKNNNMWIFQVRNIILNAPHRKKRKLHCRKKTKEHRWSMDKVYDIVKKYDGYLTSKYDTEIFEINLYLCI